MTADQVVVRLPAVFIAAAVLPNVAQLYPHPTPTPHPQKVYVTIINIRCKVTRGVATIKVKSNSSSKQEFHRLVYVGKRLSRLRLSYARNASFCNYISLLQTWTKSDCNNITSIEVVGGGGGNGMAVFVCLFDCCCCFLFVCLFVVVVVVVFWEIA